MKIFSVRSFVIMLVFALCLPFSCIEDDCPGGTGYKSKLEVRQLGIAVGSAEKSLNSVGDFSTIKTTHSDSIAIQLSVLDFFYEATANLSVEDPINFTWGSQAFACSQPPVLTEINTILTIEITSSDTITSFGNIYLPNQSLNGLFDASYLGIRDEIDMLIPELSIRFYESEHDFLLVLKQPIDPIQNHELNVQVSMNDGKVFDLKTNKFVIQ